MAFDQIVRTDGFSDLTESQQIERLREEDPVFAAAMERDPDATLEVLRRHAKSKPDLEAQQNPVGVAVRQAASGFGEAFTDTAQAALGLFAPDEKPDGLRGLITGEPGTNWASSAIEAIDEFEQATYSDEPTTPTGRIARRAGLFGGYGVQAWAGGAALGATKLPYLARGAQFLTGSMTTETLGGAAAGAAGGAVQEVTENPWARVGAEILAGGAVGLGIAARHRAKVAAREAASAGTGGQPAAGVKAGAATTAEDAYAEATTNEVRELMASAAEKAQPGAAWGGIKPDPRIMTPEFLDAADTAAAQATMDMMASGTRSTLDAATNKRIVEAGTRIAKAFDLAYDPRFPLAHQLAPLIKRNPQAVKGIMDDVGVTSTDLLADSMSVTASEAGRILQQLSVASRKLRKEMLGPLSPEARKTLKAMGLPQGRGFWKRLEDIRRGLLVTQLATAARNSETQVANLTVHGMEDSLQKAIYKLFPGEIADMHPTAGLGTVSRLLRGATGRNKAQTAAIQELFPQDMSPLFARYSSDIVNVVGTEGKLAWLEKAAHALNYFNRFQEYGIRRAAFTANLDALVRIQGRHLARKAATDGLPAGVTDEYVALLNGGLDAMERAGRLGDIDRSLVQKAVDKALELTWGKEYFYDPAKGQAHNLAAHMIGAVNRMHVGPFHATQVIPFPRFLANAIKWQYERSPMPLLRHVMSPDNWHRLANGEAAQVMAEGVPHLVRATTGTALFLSAHQLRNSEWAGERWYEVRPPPQVAEALGIEPDSTFDTRPLNPFASYLFAADIIKRINDETLDQLTTRDIAMGLMATNLRAGAGMYVLDQFLDSIAQGIQRPEDGQTAFQALAKAGAEYTSAAWAGMLVPFQQLRDVVAHFDESQRVVRDAGAAPLTGQFQRKAPYADETLPEVELPTREAPPTSEMPLLRQLTGATTRGPKNAAEREFDRIGYTRSNILPSSGDEQWDRLNAKHLGPMVEKLVSPVVESDTYKRLPEPEKKVVLGALMSRLRSQARKQAAAEAPELFIESRIRGRSRPERQIINRERAKQIERRRELAEEARRDQ